jgi:hypothetical protein
MINTYDKKVQEFETIENELPDIESKIKSHLLKGKFKITVIAVSVIYIFFLS